MEIRQRKSVIVIIESFMIKLLKTLVYCNIFDIENQEKYWTPAFAGVTERNGNDTLVVVVVGFQIV